MATTRPAGYRTLKGALLDQLDEHTAALMDALSEARAARQSLTRLLQLVERDEPDAAA